MDYYLKDKIERLFLDGYNEDQIIDAVNKITKEKVKEKELQAAREKVVEATAEYVKLLTGKDVDIADFLKDFIMMEESIKEVDPVETKETNKKRDAVNEWLKENGLLF